jgi:hypothetical protein
VARWEGFSRCPGCAFDFATGEGERSCTWGECPHLPAELDVFCSQCRFDFVTMEGNPPCPEPLTCEYALAPMSHVENMRLWQGRSPRSEGLMELDGGGRR